MIVQSFDTSNQQPMPGWRPIVYHGTAALEEAVTKRRLKRTGLGFSQHRVRSRCATVRDQDAKSLRERGGAVPDAKIKILVLTADPGSLARLNVGEEVRQIVHRIWQAEYRDRFEVVSEFAVRQGEVIELLNRHRPHVVHFSGHGSKEGQIFLLSDDNKHLPLSADTLKMILEDFQKTVRLVFLNACYSKAEAEAIAEVIDCAVGTEGGISDRAAIAFSASFYSALAYGLSIGRAVRQGKAQLKSKGLEAEGNVEVFAKRGVDYFQLHLVDGPRPDAAEEVKMTSEIETDRMGRVYISYAPSQASGAQLIARAMRDRGIPICDEAMAEDLQLTDDSITELVRSPGTASSVLALTREAVESRSVNSVELPAILERANHTKGFFVVAAAFSNFDLGGAGTSLRASNVLQLKLLDENATTTNAARIARLVLEQRIAAIHNSLDPRKPLSLELYTRVRPPFKPGTAVLIDWNERFNQRYAAPGDWAQYLLPALQDVVEVIEREAPGRSIVADGRLSLPAAVALGCGFIQPKHIKVHWTQHTLGRRNQLWSIHATKKPCGLTIETNAGQSDARDLAVLISLTNDVEPAFQSSLPELPPFRAIIRAATSPFGTDAISSAGQAADAAFRIRDAIKAAANAHASISCVHLFMAVPAGLALMIGQLFNVPVKVQTYDLAATSDGSRYRAAAALYPYG